MTVLACTSHLLVDLPLFGGPVFFVIGAVLMIRRSERRRFGAPDVRPADRAPQAPGGAGAHGPAAAA